MSKPSSSQFWPFPAEFHVQQLEYVDSHHNSSSLSPKAAKRKMYVFILARLEPLTVYSSYSKLKAANEVLYILTCRGYFAKAIKHINLIDSLIYMVNKYI